MVGFVTPVIIRVDSVTSTCLRSSFGDITTFSGPIFPASSGATAGQSCTTTGSAADANAAATRATNNATDVKAFIAKGGISTTGGIIQKETKETKKQKTRLIS